MAAEPANNSDAARRWRAKGRGHRTYIGCGGGGGGGSPQNYITSASSPRPPQHVPDCEDRGQRLVGIDHTSAVGGALPTTVNNFEAARKRRAGRGGGGQLSKPHNLGQKWWQTPVNNSESSQHGSTQPHGRQQGWWGQHPNQQSPSRSGANRGAM